MSFSPSDSPESIFSKRQSHFQGLAGQMSAKVTTISWMRMAVFLIILGLTWLGWQWSWLAALGVAFVGLVVFMVVMKWHQKVKREQQLLELQAKINEDEINRLKGKLDDFEEGEGFIDDAHPYSGDLDIFGKASLFQLLSRGTTDYGRKTLAAWLQQPAKRETVLERQSAVRELSQSLDWRQAFQAAGLRFEASGDSPSNLVEWLNMPPRLAKALKILPWYGLVSMIGTITLSALDFIPDFVPILFFFLNLGIWAIVRKKIKGAYEMTTKRTALLESYGELLGHIERLEVQSPALVREKKKVDGGGKPASKAIRQLAGIQDKLEMKYAQFVYVVLNVFFFWDVFWVHRLDDWKATYAALAPHWFEAIGEFEAYASLAALHFARPEWNFPEIPETEWEVLGEEVGHPLIPEEIRVNNPVEILGRGTVGLITGSNMSGKSTYLRTVGINVVLALAGAPVCAKKFRATPMLVFTSMRTQDALEAQTSSFYAELKRLRQVIDAAEAEPAVCFLLDEILKGTNSRDRHKGAEALIRQLHGLGASGLVSTHDLELGRLEKSEGFLRNFSFNSQLDGKDKLKFEYKLERGLCHSFNASRLMRQMGIAVEETAADAVPPSV